MSSVIRVVARDPGCSRSPRRLPTRVRDRRILCSGYNEVEVIRRFTDQRIGSFLQKPYTARRLAALAHAVLQESGRRTSQVSA